MYRPAPSARGDRRFVPKLVTALLVRNEAAPDRYLRAVLQNAKQWSDTVLVLDDQSDDATPDICREEGAIVMERGDPNHAWGNEAPARQELWDIAVEAARVKSNDGWIIFCDADQILSADPRPLCKTVELNAWCWPLLDLWDSETTHRTDGYWQASRTPRPWMVCPSRVPEGWVAEWPERGIHCGHIPQNFPFKAATAPPQYFWAHMSYLKREHRVQKHAMYLSQADQLTPWELSHANSILDG
jgi:glycosyltransferase involved in cell wall biosynthesis